MQSRDTPLLSPQSLGSSGCAVINKQFGTLLFGRGNLDDFYFGCGRASCDWDEAINNLRFKALWDTKAS